MGGEVNGRRKQYLLAMQVLQPAEPQVLCPFVGLVYAAPLPGINRRANH